MIETTHFEPPKKKTTFGKEGGKIRELIEYWRQQRDERQKRQGLGREAPNPPDKRSDTAPEPEPVQKTDLEIAETIKQLTSDNLAEYVEKGVLKRTNSGLLDGVALFGSTHAKANWREESVAPVLEKSGIFSYNPRIDPAVREWDSEKDPQAEALAMSEMSVLAMRIENKDILDGSLGSMVEMGMAALSAALNGQRVIVSIEKDIEKSLEDPGARAQYEAMMAELHAAEERSDGQIQVMYGDDMEKFNGSIELALRQQQEKPLRKKSREAFLEHERQKAAKFQDRDASDLFGGSSAPFTKDNEEVKTSFNMEQRRIRSVWNTPLALNEPPQSGWWDWAMAQPREKQGAAYKLAFMTEEPLKNKARVLIWSIQDEAVSKAAITEIGFMLLKALESGQQMMIVMEPFNAKLYVETVFKEKLFDLREQVKSQIESVNSNPAMQHYTAEEIEATNNALKAIEGYPKGTDVDLVKLIKNDHIISRTKMFRDFDNARRTRAVIEAQMRKLVDSLAKRKDEIGEPFFTFATSIDEFTDQSEKIRQKYNLPMAA